MNGKKVIRTLLTCLWIALLLMPFAAQAATDADIYYLSSQAKFSAELSGLKSGEDYCLMLSEQEPSDALQPSAVHYVRQLSATESGTISILILDDTLSDCGVWLNGEKLCEIAQVSINSQLNLPSGLIEIGESAFEGGNFSYVIIGDKVTTIGSKAFANCRELHNIEIPSSVTQIAPDAFEGCSTITVICSDNSFAKAFAEENNLSVQLR